MSEQKQSHEDEGIVIILIHSTAEIIYVSKQFTKTDKKIQPDFIIFMWYM